MEFINENAFKKEKKSIGGCVCESLTFPTPVDSESRHTEFLSLFRRFRWLEEGEMEKANESDEFNYTSENLKWGCWLED